jgi:hypothetical protein
MPTKDESAPTGDVPAVVTTPAPFVQYPTGEFCRQGSPLWVMLRMSLSVRVPEYVNETPVVLRDEIVRGPPTSITFAKHDADTNARKKRKLRKRIL